MTKTTVEPDCLPDPQQLEVEPLARHLVERAERLVHQQQRRVERERTGDRDAHLHAAGELPRVVLLEAGQLDEVEHLLHALVAALAVPAEHLERQARRSSRRCASRRAPPPGRPSRSRGRAAPDGRSCRRPRPCPSVGSTRSPITRSSVDLPQPDGPISETNSPGWRSRSMSWRACVWPPSKVFVTCSIETAAGWSVCVIGLRSRWVGARSRDVAPGRARTTSALDDHDDAEEDDPEHGRDDVRRPERRRVERVVLVEVEDRAAEPVLDRRTAARR